MRKVKTKTIILAGFFVLFSHTAISKEITEDSFIGRWCGKWDGLFEFCLVLTDLNQPAKYQWKEHPNSKFKKAEKIITRENLNTIKLENILFVLDENNLQQANAVGIFKIRSRMAKLHKKVSD